MPRKQKHDQPFGANNNEPTDQYKAYEAASLAQLQSTDELLETEQSERTALASFFEHGEKYHEAGKRDVELYIRTYNTLLRSSGEISLKALIQAHYNIDSSLHPDARKPYPDMSAFIYSVLRLPIAIARCQLVLLGQSEEVFQQSGFPVARWEAVTASARRRKWFFDGKETLAVYVASVSDTDDIVPVLVAFQIEWNKINYLLNADPTTMQLLETQLDRSSPVFAEISKVVRQRLHIAPDDWQRLEVIWGDHLWEKLREIGKERKNFALRMLGGSHVGYVKATRQWWAPVNHLLESLGLDNRPVYFVSSNTHSLVNVLSGFVLNREDELLTYAQSGSDPYLLEEYHKIKNGEVAGNWQNFLYFVAREWARTPAGKEAARNRLQEGQERGIWHLGARHGLEIDAQIVDLAQLRNYEIDPRCRMSDVERLAESNSIIINIDYPLGMAAYRMMREIMENLSQIKGIYILGKAATLNGRIGDVMISNVVLDEHSQNTYWLDNAFTVHDVEPFLIYGSVLDNQKAVSAKGTYLQNRQYLDFYYQANYTVVEMESGPYLNAVYEDQYLTRYPMGENINFRRLPYELGILHYASDTPYTRGKNLGAGSLSYFGMDSTYASTVAITRRIFEREIRSLPLSSREAAKQTHDKGQATTEEKDSLVQ
ncbi:DUF6909 family protein [Tengunoibacter tsumagoiensis]|uniref:Uncharacterized protein n=1 Tax=Tengunoibacter tsumagoiensis TaxID=2014871 RepID=A0A401ZVU7_9CHLR|nr:hypothetical protein [Tengunoibacter tsumagoiensis]GCE10854.1 hypothetical protein KTT_07130 [Tengunoibacter tsumagoiensis]